MNEGRVLKLFYSPDPKVAQIIKKAVNAWPFGYCKHISSLQEYDGTSWLIKVCEQEDVESTETIINAYMHIQCGFSMFCVDGADIGGWLCSGKKFTSLTIQGRHKELAYELWVAFNEAELHQKNLGFDISTVLLTVTGNLIPPEEVSLYYSIIRDRGCDVIFNTCLFDNQNIDNQIKLHLSLNPSQLKANA